MVYNRPISVEISDDEYLTLYGTVAKAKQRLYNIGAGTWSHAYWTNIDLPAQTEEFAAIQAPCVPHDLIAQSDFPIPTETVDAFYCSHVVEHLPDNIVLNMMKEAFRCLDKGGVFRITTGPCADLDWNALLRNDENWWFWFKDADSSKAGKKNMGLMSIYDQWLYSVATPRSPWSETECQKKYCTDEVKKLVEANKANPRTLLDTLTQSLEFDYSSPGNHISWWNSSKLHELLSLAGFRNIYRSGYGQSASVLMRDLRYFDQTYPQISVYVEAVK